MNSMLRRKHTYQTEKLTRCYRQQKLIHTMIQTTKKHWLTLVYLNINLINKKIALQYS